MKKYQKEPPYIEIFYHIEHTLNMNGFDDGILRFKNFIVYNNDGHVVSSGDGKYVITAVIMLRYEIDPKFVNDYKDEMKNKENLDDFILSLEKLISRFSWNYYNTTSHQPVKKSEVQNIFNIPFPEWYAPKCVEA